MTIYIKSINRNGWKVVETKIEIANLENLSTAKEVLLQNNNIALSAIQDALDERTFEQIKNIKMARGAWKKLEKSFEGTQAVKGAKAYILKEKFASFKMKKNESVPEMFHRLQRFDKFMVKKGYYARRKKSSSRNKDEARKCSKCGSKDHLIAQCPYNSENEDDDKKDKKKDKKEKKEKDNLTFKKKKKGDSYVITRDSDASSSDDDDSNDDKTTKKKALTSITINEKPSLFDTPSTCFMAKATKIKTCHDGCDEEHDNESESNDDDEPTKNELIDMLEDAKEHFDIKRRECKDLRKELKALKQAFDELIASYERQEMWQNCPK
ncbi:uncharacterized protein [Miscanthus floridulus]|uniref:uncharacterized protein n=1 Tax=Miscanthus floridulus TaxID=154761 RepID=UPI003458BFDF